MDFIEKLIEERISGAWRYAVYHGTEENWCKVEGIVTRLGVMVYGMLTREERAVLEWLADVAAWRSGYSLCSYEAECGAVVGGCHV